MAPLLLQHTLIVRLSLPLTGLQQAVGRLQGLVGHLQPGQLLLGGKQLLGGDAEPFLVAGKGIRELGVLCTERLQFPLEGLVMGI